ncbi:unnamed protein product [Amoebophrya sp. A120]|nr:unnamed protein product [Amoebophrya sp. A120]|eukprot:GSA120T00017591001.1
MLFSANAKRKKMSNIRKTKRFQELPVIRFFLVPLFFVLSALQPSSAALKRVPATTRGKFTFFYSENPEVHDRHLGEPKRPGRNIPVKCTRRGIINVPRRQIPDHAHGIYKDDKSLQETCLEAAVLEDELDDHPLGEYFRREVAAPEDEAGEANKTNSNSTTSEDQDGASAAAAGASTPSSSPGAAGNEEMVQQVATSRVKKVEDEPPEKDESQSGSVNIVPDVQVQPPLSDGRGPDPALVSRKELLQEEHPPHWIPDALYREMVEKTVIACVDVLLYSPKRKKYLLLKRSTEPIKGWFGFVGGRMHHGESFEEAAVRKLEQECNVRAILTQRVIKRDQLDEFSPIVEHKNETAKDKLVQIKIPYEEGIIGAYDTWFDKSAQDEKTPSQTMNTLVYMEILGDDDSFDDVLSVNEYHSEYEWFSEEEYLSHPKITNAVKRGLKDHLEKVYRYWEPLEFGKLDAKQVVKHDDVFEDKNNPELHQQQNSFKQKHFELHTNRFHHYDNPKAFHDSAPEQQHNFAVAPAKQVVTPESIPHSLYTNMLKKAVMVCVDAILYDVARDKFFMVRRDHEPMKGKPRYPGSRVYKGERLEETTFRIFRRYFDPIVSSSTPASTSEDGASTDDVPLLPRTVADEAKFLHKIIRFVTPPARLAEYTIRSSAVGEEFEKHLYKSTSSDDSQQHSVSNATATTGETNQSTSTSNFYPHEYFAFGGVIGSYGTHFDHSEQGVAVHTKNVVTFAVFNSTQWREKDHPFQGKDTRLVLEGAPVVIEEAAGTTGADGSESGRGGSSSSALSSTKSSSSKDKHHKAADTAAGEGRGAAVVPRKIQEHMDSLNKKPSSLVFYTIEEMAEKLSYYFHSVFADFVYKVGGSLSKDPDEMMGFVPYAPGEEIPPDSGEGEDEDWDEDDDEDYDEDYDEDEDENSDENSDDGGLHGNEEQDHEHDKEGSSREDHEHHDDSHPAPGVKVEIEDVEEVEL